MKKEKKPGRRLAKDSNRAASEQKLIALTLKIERQTYQRLVQLRAKGEKLRTHQEILRQALEEYLDRAGV